MFRYVRMCGNPWASFKKWIRTVRTMHHNKSTYVKHQENSISWESIFLLIERGGQQAALACGTTRRYRGTGVKASGRVEQSTSNDEADEESDEEEGRERLGFDRLRTGSITRLKGRRKFKISSFIVCIYLQKKSGLSCQEITAIPSYFSCQVDWYLQSNPPTGEEETDALQRRFLQEDTWMTKQCPASEFRLNLNQNAGPAMLWRQEGTPLSFRFRSSIGTNSDFLWGFLPGFFVGFLMLIWVWMPSVPHKQK